MPQFSCPKCGRIHTVKEEDIGSHGTCPCGQRLLISAKTKLAKPYSPQQKTAVVTGEEEANRVDVTVSSSGKPSKTNKKLIWIIAAVGCLWLFVCAAIPVGTWLYFYGGHSESTSHRLFEREELEVKLSQVTAKEVRAILGNPAEIAQPVIGIKDDPSEDVWMYHNRTRDPKTGKPDPDLMIRFRFGRVYLVVCTPLRSMPQNGNGLEGLQLRW